MPGKKKSILIADDDSDYLYQLSFYLQKAGYSVITADSQKEAEKIIQREKPDLAILDLMMENEDSGFILSHKIRRKYPDVPIIIATADSSETGITFGLKSDEDKQWIKADLYLEKGVNPDTLLNEIKKLLNKA